MPVDVTGKLRDVQQFEGQVNGPGEAKSLTLISGEVADVGLD